MNLALFDFDGTITEGDTFSPFLRFAVGRGRALIGGLLASPAVLAYRLGVVSAGRTRPIGRRVGFQGEQDGDGHRHRDQSARRSFLRSEARSSLRRNASGDRGMWPLNALSGRVSRA